MALIVTISIVTITDPLTHRGRKVPLQMRHGTRGKLWVDGAERAVGRRAVL